MDPPTSSGDVNFIDDFVLVKRDVGSDVGSTFPFTLPPRRGSLGRNPLDKTIVLKTGKEG